MSKNQKHSDQKFISQKFFMWETKKKDNLKWMISSEGEYYELISTRNKNNKIKRTIKINISCGKKPLITYYMGQWWSNRLPKNQYMICLSLNYHYLLWIIISNRTFLLFLYFCEQLFRRPKKDLLVYKDLEKPIFSKNSFEGISPFSFNSASLSRFDHCSNTFGGIA